MRDFLRFLSRAALVAIAFFALLEIAFGLPESFELRLGLFCLLISAAAFAGFDE